MRFLPCLLVSLTLLGSALLAHATGPAPRQDPDAGITFHEANASKLRVKVLQVRAGLPGTSSLAELRVKNTTKHWVEPLEFRRPTPSKDKRDPQGLVPRVAAPYGTRIGAAIPPRGERVYWVNVSGEPDGIKTSGWKVTQASFAEYQDQPPELAPVLVGRISKAPAERNLQGIETPFSRIELSNPEARVVDVLLLAKFRAPKQGEAILQCRLQPGERKSWVVEGPCTQVPGCLDFRGSDIESVELLEVSALTDHSQQQATDLLRAAWNGRARWPSPRVEYRADYRAVIQRWDHSTNAKVQIVEEGTLVSQGDEVRLTPKPAKGESSAPKPQVEGWTLLQRANRLLQRPAFEDWMEGRQAYLHSQTGKLATIAVQTGSGAGATWRFYWIEQGDWVGETLSPWPPVSTPRWWTLETTGGQQVPVRETDWENRDHQPAHYTQYDYAYKVIQGVPIPERLKHSRFVMPAERSSVVTLVLQKIELSEASLEPATPAGD